MIERTEITKKTTKKLVFFLCVTFKNKNVYILASTKEKAKKICALLNENEILNKYEEKLNNTIIVKNQEGIIIVSLGTLSAGFENYDLNQAVIIANERL